MSENTEGGERSGCGRASGLFLDSPARPASREGPCVMPGGITVCPGMKTVDFTKAVLLQNGAPCSSSPLNRGLNALCLQILASSWCVCVCVCVSEFLSKHLDGK